MEKFIIKYKGKDVEVMGWYGKAIKENNLTAPTSSEFEIHNIFYKDIDIYSFIKESELEVIEELVLKEIEE